MHGEPFEPLQHSRALHQACTIAAFGGCCLLFPPPGWVGSLWVPLGTSGVSKSQVPQQCEDIDGMVKAFLDRPIEVDWRCFRVDVPYRTVRRGGRIVGIAAIILISVNADARISKPTTCRR